jgi:lysophospholipase L1-like esterase
MRVAPKLTALLAGVALALTACAAPPAGGAPIPASPSPSSSAESVRVDGSDDADLSPVSIAIVGDSLTAGLSADFAGGRFDPATWVTTLFATDSSAEFAGGWAQGGATTTDMLGAVQPQNADLLIVMAGTNDIQLGIRPETSLANVDAIAERVGASEVMVSAIPPLQVLGGAAEEYNALLKAHVEQKGWTFVDPYAALRDASAYRDGMTVDGIHPTAEGQLLVGEAIARAVDQLGRA